MERHPDVSVLVLAGGRGTRIAAIHPETPKPMIPVLGQPFLYWLTLYLARFGLDHFVYSTGYRADQIETWCADGTLSGVTRESCREAEPLGTGGGVLNCLHLCRDWVLVANGDGLCIGGVAELLALRDRKNLTGGMIGAPVQDASRYGSLKFADNCRLWEFREKVPGPGYINSGFYLFRKAALMSLRRSGPSSIERDLIPGLIADGADLRVIPLADVAFIDIGIPETLAQAEDFVRANLLA